MQEVQREQQLGGLTPKRGFITVQTLERAAVELGKSQEAASHRPIFVASAIDGRFELRPYDVTRLDFATRGIASPAAAGRDPGDET
jgi:hypothetical protein